MQYISYYNSPLGKLLLTTNETKLTGLFFEKQKGYTLCLKKGYEEKETSLIMQIKQWLDLYFKGINPGFIIPIQLEGTSFQKEVWEILLQIPYGETMTYGNIAKIIANKRGIKYMSAQAVGGAVGSNPISILVPCHRVIGSNGSLTGYAGGINLKIALLKLEKQT